MSTRNESRQLIDCVTPLSAPAGAALAMYERLKPLARFGALCLDEHRSQLGDIDGAWMQETAVECGLLEQFEATEDDIRDCGDDCCCEAGDTCYRLTQAAKAMDHE